MSSNSRPPATILNFRDLASVNGLVEKSFIKPGLVFRSARPDKATVDDLRKLASDFDIKSTIDLRSGPPKHRAQRSEFDGPEKHYVDLNGHAYRMALLKQLPWSPYLKLISLMAVNRRAAAIRIMGENVMTPRGLTGLAIDTLNASKKEFREIFELLAQPSAYPFHLYCQQGKDRTGLTVILLLLLLRTPQSAINEDYLLSATELEPEKTERLQELRDMGLPDSYAGCDPGLVDAVVEWLSTEYGDVVGYLSSIGVAKSAQDSIRHNLLV